MYKVYYNHTNDAHTIATFPQDEENDVAVFEGSLDECRDYLGPLHVIFQTILEPEFDGAGFSHNDN